MTQEHVLNLSQHKKVKNLFACVIIHNDKSDYYSVTKIVIPCLHFSFWTAVKYILCIIDRSLFCVIW